MNFIALKMLIGDKMKYIALVAGVAFAALLITQQGSIFSGFAFQIGAWIRDTSFADLWIVEDQMQFSEDFKPMSETALNRVRGIPGVAWAVPMYKSYLKTRLPDGTMVQTRVIGLDDTTLAGGPPRMAHGNLEDLRMDRAVIIEASQASGPLALNRGRGRPLAVGDRISINDNEAIVAGTYHATREFFWDPVVYTTYTRALSWAPRERRTLTYVLARVAPGHDIPEVARRIRASTGLAAYTNAEFDRMSTMELLQKTGILINFGITIALGFVIGILVAGQTFYTFVLDNLRHFAALKAMGASNGTVLRMLCVQILAVAGIGYGLGVGLASLTGLFAVEGLAFRMAWQIPVVGAIAVLCCSIIAGFLGMVRVLRLEPAVVFK